MFFRDRREIAALTEIIGDPHTDEQKWMTACAGLGEYSTDRRSELSKILMPEEVLQVLLPMRSMGQYALPLWIGMMTMLSSLLIIIAVNDLADTFGVLNIAKGIRSLLSQQIPMATFFFFGTVGFWQRFSAESTAKARAITFYALSISIVSLMCLSFGWEYWLKSLILVPLIAAIGFMPMNALAAFTRKALPNTFRAERALFFVALSSLPLFATIISDHFIPWNLHLSEPILCLTALLGFALSAFATTRVARSTDIKSSLCLSAIISSPLIIGTIGVIILSTAFDFPTAINAYTAYWTAAAFAALLLPLFSIAAGSYLGVQQNRHILATSAKRLRRAQSMPKIGR